MWITTPYFAPPDGGLRILQDAAARGVDVRLLLPGAFGRAASCGTPHTARTRACCAAGVRIFEYERAVLHAKTMVCDDHLSVVGSANLDFRSLWFNAECNLMIADERTAARLEALFEGDIGQSREVTLAAWRERSLLHRLGDRLARGLRVLL